VFCASPFGVAHVAHSVSDHAGGDEAVPVRSLKDVGHGLKYRRRTVSSENLCQRLLGDRLTISVWSVKLG
jgi:hypothetical protein